MTCPICLSRIQSDTEDCLAEHLVEVHGFSLLEGGRVAHRIGYWRACEAMMARNEPVGERRGDTLAACA